MKTAHKIENKNLKKTQTHNPESKIQNNSKKINKSCYVNAVFMKCVSCQKWPRNHYK